MRRLWVPSLLLVVAVSCGVSRTQMPATTGRLVVHVYWQDQGVSGIPIELLGTGETKTTDENGDALFNVPPGHYVVRAYNINRGGPCCGYLDLDATVHTGQVTRLSIATCLPCV